MLQESFVNNFLLKESGSENLPEIEEGYVLLDGARMRYLRSGSGPPLALVDGLLGYSLPRRFPMPVLSPHFPAYAVDMLGSGFFERPPRLDCSVRAGSHGLPRR